MGVRGQRKNMLKDSAYFTEPKLVNNVDSIIRHAQENGFVDKKNNLDLLKLAQSLNICIIKEEMDSTISGYLKFNHDSNQWIIGINSLHAPRRQRFTLAHEIGHYYLHKDKNTEFNDTTFFRKENNSSIEYAANEFASQLVMPEERLRNMVTQGIVSLSALADEFEVSVAAMRYRVVALGYKLK